MAILVISTSFSPEEWVKALREQDPQLDIRVWPEVGDPEAIDFALVWIYPHGELNKYPNLKCIASMGAGVDQIIYDHDLPPNIPVVKVVDTYLTRDMSQYVVAATLNYICRFDQYRKMQQQHSWHKLPNLETSIGIMGLGALGSDAACKLTALGCKINGWSRTRKQIPEVQCFHGQGELESFLAASNIVVCLIPHTPTTENILNYQTMQQMPKRSYLINVARGALVEENDLLTLLNNNHLAGAWLDVFKQEPLPSDHPFWNHPKIRLTPHIASVSRPSSAAKQIIYNYKRMLANNPLINVVNLTHGY